MRTLLKLLLCVLVAASAGCGDYKEVTRETGYKGKARMNPWLAAERFAEGKGHTVVSATSWKDPEWTDAVYFVPVEVLNNAGFISKFGPWISNGGHLVLLGDYSEAEWNDWYEAGGRPARFEPPLRQFLEKAGFTFPEEGSGSFPRIEPVNGSLPVPGADDTGVSRILFEGESYDIDPGVRNAVRSTTNEEQVFASVKYNYGRITVVMDARIFRSRYIDKNDHAPLLGALIRSSSHTGSAVFVRGAGISLWKMLGRHLWPVLVGLAVLLVLWLWKSFSRFGPVESSLISSPLRGYDHHLEALGDFQWRLDKASTLLAPIRERIVENGQRLAAASGRRDADFFQFLAERSALTRGRVERALTETSPPDAAVLTRVAGDLQRLVEVVR